MFTSILDNRGKEFSTLVKLGDLLGRSLRENVELFSIEEGKVTYLTESGNIVKASYSIKNPVHLYNIEVDSVEILENEEVFSNLIENRVGKMLDNILNSDYASAEDSLDNVLDMWSTRLSFDRIQKRLEEKSKRFGPQNYIIDTEEFSNLVEIKDQLVKFLKENSELIDIPEIKNAVKLASVVSTYFDLPKRSLDQIKEGKLYYRQRKNDSLYEHLCQQELLAKEILEAKNNFSNSWGTNEKISKLASKIYSEDKEILQALAECISDIPYMAMATKKQLSDVITAAISMEAVEADVTTKDITNFVSKIYESKKPAKDQILKLLNEKYNINVNTLTETPTFKSLLYTEIVIFESLSKLAPKASVLKKVLAEVASMLKLKNGVESIDVTDFLNEVFKEAGYKTKINETSLLQYMDFNQVADDLSKIGQVLKMLRPIAQGMPQMGGQPDPMMQPKPEMEGGIGAKGQYEDDMDPGIQAGEDVDVPVQGAEDAAIEADVDADMENNDLGAPEEEGLEGVAPGEEGMGEELPPEEEAPEQVDQAELMDKMSELDELLAILKDDMGLGDESEGDEGEAFGGEETPEEEAAEEEMEGEEGEKGDDVHVDVNVDADDDDDNVDIGGDDEEESGEEPDKKFEKNFSKKMNKKK